MPKAASWRNVRFSPYQTARAMRAAYKTGQFAKKVYNKFRGTDGTSGGVVTTAQHDYRQQYRYKRMPPRKRKRWARQVKRNQFMDLYALAPTTILRNDTLTTSVPKTGEQGFLKCHIYGREGDTDGGEAGNNDIAFICQKDARINNQTAFKMFFTSAVMDATIRNTGTTNIEVDIYDISYRDATKWPSFQQMYVSAYTAVPKIGTAGQTEMLGLNNRGATLFDLPELIRYGRIKIYKKTKVYLPAGQTTNYQIRLPKTQKITSNNLIDDTGFIIRRMTRTLLVVAKNVVGTPGGAEDPNGELKIGLTRKYAYKLAEQKQSASSALG